MRLHEFGDGSVVLVGVEYERHLVGRKGRAAPAAAALLDRKTGFGEQPSRSFRIKPKMPLPLLRRLARLLPKLLADLLHCTIVIGKDARRRDRKQRLRH